MPDSLSPDEARERLTGMILDNLETPRAQPVAEAAISDPDALAVLIPPDQMLQAYERAGKVEKLVHTTRASLTGRCSCDDPHAQMQPVYRITEEGETP